MGRQSTDCVKDVEGEIVVEVNLGKTKAMKCEARFGPTEYL